MNRIDVRSKENWKRFDFWAVIICILLLLLMFIVWKAGAGFGGENCCNDEEVVEQAAPIVAPPKPEPVVIPEPEPVIVAAPKEDYSLNFFRAGDNIVLEGTVADEITRDGIIFDAQQRFGKDNVISNLKIADNIAEFDTMNLAGMFGQLSDVNDFRLAISPEKWSVFGTVSNEGLYNNLRANFSGTVDTLVENEGRSLEADNRNRRVEFKPL